MENLDDADPDEPRCKVRSKNFPGSIIPVPSTQDHDPAYMVRVLAQNTPKQEWERLTGVTINPWYTNVNISRELSGMLRHGHWYYYVHMAEYGYVLFYTISTRCS